MALVLHLSSDLLLGVRRALAVKTVPFVFVTAFEEISGPERSGKWKVSGRVFSIWGPVGLPGPRGDE